MFRWRIKPNGFAEIRWHVIRRTLVLSVVAMLVGFAISWNNLGPGQGSDGLLLAIPIVIGSLAIGLFIGLRRQKEIFESYELELTETHITQRRKNTPDTSIALDEIQEIRKTTNGVLTIKSENRFRSIIVPIQIENRHELESILSDITEIKSDEKKAVTSVGTRMLPFLVMGLMFLVYSAENKWLVGAAGVLTAAILLWSFITMQRSTQLDHRTKRLSWIVMVVLASVVYITWQKVMGAPQYR